MIALRRAFLFVVLPCILGYTVGCLTDAMTKDVAGGLYAAQQQACIDQGKDRASIDACRDDVKKKWDAGQEAGK